MSVDASTRTAVVTGGGKGIGRAITLALACAGHRVVAFGRDTAALAGVAAEAQGQGRVTFQSCDVTDEASVADAFTAVGRVDVLVNNAGISASNPLARVSLAEWDEHLRVNATAPFLCTRAVLLGMRERGFGRVVTVASTASHRGGAYIAAYAASKHAVLGLMRSVAAEVAGTGVTANCVCPAFVRSEMTERTIANIVARTGRDPEDAETGLVRSSGLGRLLEPEEVAAAVVWLAGDSAAAINGQAIVLDGGEL